MAKAKGLIKFRGKVDGKSFLEMRGVEGTVVKTATGPSKERIDNDPNYAEQKENYTVFGLASHSSMYIRDAFKPVMDSISRGYTHSRMMKPARKICKQEYHGQVHPFETEAVKDFRGFCFCDGVRIDHVLLADLKKDLHDGVLYLALDNVMSKGSRGATHFRIISSVAGVDFGREKYCREDDVSDFIKYSYDFPVERIELKNNMPMEYPVIFHVLTLVHYELVNGKYYKDHNSKRNAAEIIQVFRNCGGELM